MPSFLPLIISHFSTIFALYIKFIVIYCHYKIAHVNNFLFKDHICIISQPKVIFVTKSDPSHMLIKFSIRPTPTKQKRNVKGEIQQWNKNNSSQHTALACTDMAEMLTHHKPPMSQSAAGWSWYNTLQVAFTYI